MMEEPMQESHRGRGLALVVILVLAVAAGAWMGLFWLPGFREENFQLGFANGYGAGTWDGNATGYNLGLQSGYARGLEDGYEEGSYTAFNKGYTSGRTDGYDLGYADGALEGYDIHDPTYTEAIAFVQENMVDQHEYTPTYICFDFCRDFEAAAYEKELRVGFVYILMKGGAHSIVVFDTSDQGLLFIEPQDDRAVTPQIGQSYWNRAYYSPEYDDTVTYYAIIW
jgi:hypothetical protein